MLLLLVGGSISILVLWWARGRDPAIGPIADFLSEPPDDLSPGAAGTLIDEQADHRDVLATLLGMGRNGAVTIAQLSSNGKEAPKYFHVTVVEPDKIVSPLERTLLHALFGNAPAAGAHVQLHDVHGRFTAAEPAVRDALYNELVDRGYFQRSPAETRKHWQRISWTGLVLSVIAGGLLGILLDPFAFLAMIAGIIISLVLLRVSRSMPQKTLAGAEAAAKWQAFRRYLQHIEKYEKLQEAQDLFDRYLAYAVAFELDKQWLKTFAAAGTTQPGWFQAASDPDLAGSSIGDIIFTAAQIGHVFGGSGSGHHASGGASIPDIDLPNMPDLPNVDLQRLSDIAGSGLQGASDAFAGLLDLAGSIFDAINNDSNS